jgi:hypothetical protein
MENLSSARVYWDSEFERHSRYLVYVMVMVMVMVM